MSTFSTSAKSTSCKGKKNTSVSTSQALDGVNPPTATIKGTSQNKWKTSEGKKFLEKELHDASSRFHQMSIKEIHASDHRLSVHPINNFTTNFKNLKKKLYLTNQRVEFDNRAVSEHKMTFCRTPKTKGGYPHWDGHPSKKYLEDDVQDGTADRMAPRELRKTRECYKEFPLEIFCKRVHSVKQKQKESAFWVEKRNRKGMKQRLVEVAEMN